MKKDEKFHTVRGYQILEQNKKLLTSSMEDYLEMIYRQSLIEGYVRVNILSGLLNVQAPSASKMVQKLTKLGLLDYKKYGIIFLTETGRELGAWLLQRHYTIETFLKHLGVTEGLLAETELIEHTLSAAALKKIEIFNKFMEINPQTAKSLQKFIVDEENC